MAKKKPKGKNDIDFTKKEERALDRAWDRIAKEKPKRKKK